MKVAKLKGVRIETIRKWTLLGKLEYELRKGGHRRYPLEQLENQKSEEKRITVLYARVWFS